MALQTDRHQVVVFVPLMRFKRLCLIGLDVHAGVLLAGKLAKL